MGVAKSPLGAYVYSKSSLPFLPAICSTSGRIDTEFLSLLFYQAHRESEEFFRLTGRPNVVKSHE
jgi:hypothetical protein